MASYLRQNTATKICIGPFVDKTDGYTPEVALTVANLRTTAIAETDDNSLPTIILDNVAGGDATNTIAHITNDDAGYYSLILTAANLNRVGRFKITVYHVATVECLMVFHEFVIIPQKVYDSMVAGTDNLEVDAIQWLGDVIVAVGTTGVPKVDLVRIDNNATNGNNATLNLKQLNIVNSAGSAIIATGGGASGHGIFASGGSTTANGIKVVGGTGTGSGIDVSTTSGDGITAIGGTAGHGINATGAGAGNGIIATGGNSATTGGLKCVGGASGAHGIYAAGHTAGNGALLTGGNSGTTGGLKCTGAAATAQGVYLLGNTTGGGLVSSGGSNGDGIYAVGGASAGHGLNAQTGAGAGYYGIYAYASAGGAVFKGINGAGLSALCTTSGDGFVATGAATGSGIKSTGGATGHGIMAQGGATGGDGIYAAAVVDGDGICAEAGSNAGDGIYAQGAAVTGNGIHAVSIGGLGGTSDGGHGLRCVGVNAGSGIYCKGGDTGTSGHGLTAQGGVNNGNGIVALGGVLNGHGIVATGIGTGHGISATGGPTSGRGLSVIGGGTGDGLYAASGTGATGQGIYAVALSTDGAGIYGGSSGTAGFGGIHGSGGAGAGPGIRGDGGLSGNTMGMQLIKHASGKDIDADEIDAMKGTDGKCILTTDAQDRSSTLSVNAKAVNASTAAAIKLALSADTMIAGTVTNAVFSPTTTEFEAGDITDALADKYVGRDIIFTTGTSGIRMATRIEDYYLSGGGRGHFTVTALPVAPSNTDTFIIV